MRILTSILILAPVGGIELGTLQDGGVLASRGHAVLGQYQIDGPQHGDYLERGVELDGPYGIALDKRNPLRSVREFFRSAKAARRFAPDVLWLNRPEHILWASFVARICRIPIVGQLHRAPSATRPRWVNRLLLGGVRHFAAVSEFTRGQWVERGLRPERVSVLYNAIDLEDYPMGGLPEAQASRESLGIEVDSPVVLYYGRISRDKGVPTLIDAWKRLGRSDATLVIVGLMDDEYEPDFTASLAELAPSSYRVFPAQSDVIPFLHAADVVVVPTPEHEAFGRAVIEGLATGRPVIATRVGGIPEILAGDLTRFLVNPSDDVELAESLDRMIDWRESEPHLGAACRQRVEDGFPYAAHIDSLEVLLEGGLSRPPFGSKPLTLAR